MAGNDCHWNRRWKLFEENSSLEFGVLNFRPVLPSPTGWLGRMACPPPRFHTTRPRTAQLTPTKINLTVTTAIVWRHFSRSNDSHNPVHA